MNKRILAWTDPVALVSAMLVGTYPIVRRNNAMHTSRRMRPHYSQAQLTSFINAAEKSVGPTFTNLPLITSLWRKTR